jgi:hypothetical protein
VDADRDGAALKPYDPAQPEAPAAQDQSQENHPAAADPSPATLPEIYEAATDHEAAISVAIPHQRPSSNGTVAPTPTSDLRDFLRVTGQLSIPAVILGVVVGVVWVWVAPDVLLRQAADGAYLNEIEGGRMFARNGWFAVLAAGAGVLTAIVGWLRHQRLPVPLLVGLVIAGLLGSVVAWRLGVALGPDSVTTQQASLGDDQPLQAPLRLDTPGVLFAWPILSVATVFVLALFQRSRRHLPAHRRR